MLITNTSNSIFEGNTVGEHLEVVHNVATKEMLYKFYKVKSDEELIAACASDWRFVIPKDIAVEGFIPRTPYVKLSTDENWKPLSRIEENLLEVVEEKRKSAKTTRRT